MRVPLQGYNQRCRRYHFAYRDSMHYYATHRLLRHLLPRQTLSQPLAVGRVLARAQ